VIFEIGIKTVPVIGGGKLFKRVWGGKKGGMGPRHPSGSPWLTRTGKEGRPSDGLKKKTGNALGVGGGEGQKIGIISALNG